MKFLGGLHRSFLIMFLTAVGPQWAVAQGLSCASVFSAQGRTSAPGEALVQEHLTSFEQMFRETSGFKDYASYEKMIRSRTEPEIQKAIEVLDQHQVEVRIAAHEAAREPIAAEGFKNTFETNTNAGHESPAREWRDLLETDIFGFHQPAYAKHAGSPKPKYGAIRPKAESGLIDYAADALKPYGTDSYHLKTEAISSRLSFTIDDSGAVSPFPRTSSKEQWFNQISKGRSWYHSAIPWSRRLLMVPFLARGIQHDNLFLATSFNKSYNMDLNGPRTEMSSSYIEAQIFGKVDLNMVSAFEFANNPPTGQFLRTLQDHQIKILDGRQQPPVEWLP